VFSQLLVFEMETFFVLASPLASVQSGHYHHQIQLAATENVLKHT
jgi:hypothetical protein